MRFAALSWNEIVQGLQDGSIMEGELSDTPGALGAAIRLHLAATNRALLWPDRDLFLDKFVDALRKAKRPQQLADIAARMGCDQKTLLKHTTKHLGCKRWREVLAKLIAGEIPGYNDDKNGVVKTDLALE